MSERRAEEEKADETKNSLTPAPDGAMVGFAITVAVLVLLAILLTSCVVVRTKKTDERLMNHQEKMGRMSQQLEYLDLVFDERQSSYNRLAACENELVDAKRLIDLLERANKPSEPRFLDPCKCFHIDEESGIECIRCSDIELLIPKNDCGCHGGVGLGCDRPCGNLIINGYGNSSTSTQTIENRIFLK